jgi:hypothetical protein
MAWRACICGKGGVWEDCWIARLVWVLLVLLMVLHIFVIVVMVVVLVIRVLMLVLVMLGMWLYQLPPIPAAVR